MCRLVCADCAGSSTHSCDHHRTQSTRVDAHTCAHKALAAGQAIRYTNEKNGQTYARHNTETAGTTDTREHSTGFQQEEAISKKQRDLMAEALAQLTWQLPSTLLGNHPIGFSLGASSGQADGTGTTSAPLAITYGDMPASAKEAVTEALEVDWLHLRIRRTNV